VRATTPSALDALYCSQYPIKSGIPQQDQLIDRPLYRPNAVEPGDRNRYIAAYTPAEGKLEPDLDWTRPPIADPGSGSTYQDLEAFTYTGLELMTYEEMENTGLAGFGERFEVLGPFDVPTTHRLINDGLKQCWMVVEVVCVPTSLKSRHNLSVVAPWLQDPTDVLQVGYLKAYDDRDLSDPYENVVRGTVDRDGGDMYLNTGTTSFLTDDVLYLRVLKRAYDHCRPSGGVFGSQTGLVLETDEAPVERDWCAAAALVVAWRRFAHLLEPQANQRLIRDQASAAAWFTDRCREHFTAPLPQRTLRRRRYFGPPRQLAGQYWG
jgi:hypothetical protein